MTMFICVCHQCHSYLAEGAVVSRDATLSYYLQGFIVLTRVHGGIHLLFLFSVLVILFDSHPWPVPV